MDGCAFSSLLVGGGQQRHSLGQVGMLFAAYSHINGAIRSELLC
jgi:hypothetical protein